MKKKTKKQVAPKAFYQAPTDVLLSTEEANALVQGIISDIWDRGIVAKTAHLHDQQRWLIVNRAVSFIVGQMYLPVITRATNDAMTYPELVNKR